MKIKQSVYYKMMLIPLLAVLSCLHGCHKVDLEEYPGTVTDYDGNVYVTIKIGDQVWMASNLRVTHYSDGSAIPLVTGETEWKNMGNNSTDKAYCWYDNDQATYGTDWGALYTWAAAMNGAPGSGSNPSGVQGACPAGWHIPSIAEWTELKDFLISDGFTYNQGKALKALSGWDDDDGEDGNGTDDFGFAAYPGGSRETNYGHFIFAGGNGYWKSATESDDNYASGVHMGNYRDDLFIYKYLKGDGQSVRCVKD
jgi:uncharacterized protein (TIGR02145 family)